MMMRKQGKTDSHGHGIVGRMTSTDRSKGEISQVGEYKLRPTEAECAEDEKEGRNGNEEWTCYSCEPVSPAFDAFEAGKDKARAGTGHMMNFEGECGLQ
jgi:hypothetical protein